LVVRTIWMGCTTINVEFCVMSIPGLQEKENSGINSPAEKTTVTETSGEAKKEKKKKGVPPNTQRSRQEMSTNKKKETNSKAPYSSAEKKLEGDVQENPYRWKNPIRA